MDTKKEHIFIVRCGEVALKGMNKPYFERMLVERIKKLLKKFDGISVKRQEGLIFVRADGALNKQEIIHEISKVFGVASISPAVECESTMESIGEAAVKYMLEAIDERGIKTFKVEAKRADKNFPVKSPEIGRQIGAVVLKGCKVLKVDVHHPDCLLFVDVRHDKSYIYQDKIAGFGGLPLGTNGKGLSLLSGGIDSPVATWMMAKRGVALEMVHFYSYPYTSPEAREKVLELAKLLTPWCGRLTVHVVPFTHIQEELRRSCPEDYFTLLMRRFMMRIAEGVARRTGCRAVVTGESLGQVASQTMDAMAVTGAVTALPIFRPLVGMDKEEAVRIARKIGTFETSILPYEDCCTVFTPRHPRTRPRLEDVEAIEEPLDMEGLVKEALEGIERVQVGG